MTIEPMLFGDFLKEAIHVNHANDVVAHIGEHEFHGAASFALHGLTQLPFFLALAGFALASYVYLKKISIAENAKKTFKPIYNLLQNKYGFDDFNQKYIAGGLVALGNMLWKWSDSKFIDGLVVNGSAKVVNKVSKALRGLQSGYIYHYALVMAIAVIFLIGRYVL
jgi:NADH-quinone oxidoreductase subunit L